MSKFLLLLAVGLVAFSAGAVEVVQGRFIGPVRLKVWKHWQKSWNVERDTSFPPLFELVRGTRDGAPFLRLAYVTRESGLHARFSGRAFLRNGEYADAEGEVPVTLASGRRDGDRYVFDAPGDAFVDKPGKQILTVIRFEVFHNDTSLYSYELRPMFVRGAANYHWQNQIDPYSAHGGSGNITVANGASAETKTEFWNGVMVRPTLDFIDLNTLGPGATIGAHRHEANQEMWLVAKGGGWVTHGMAPIVSRQYQVERQWDSSGRRERTDQFDAEGGWLEERPLGAFEYMVIVPNPEHRETNVCFHALTAGEDSITFTMGTKN